MPCPFDPSPSTRWTVHLGGKVASCEVQFVPLGNEVQILRNGSLLMSRIFGEGEEAQTWAKEERERLAKERCVAPAIRG
jgi:hypothetical protein